MKPIKPFLVALALIITASCTHRDKSSERQPNHRKTERQQVVFSLDKGFSEYITGYSSGIISANSIIEIHLTPEFAAGANKKITSGIFSFIPAIKGKTEWADDNTIVFRPSGLLDPGMTYTGEVNLFRLGEVQDRLKVFPLRIQTLRKDFVVETGIPEFNPENNSYALNGELTASDFIEPSEAEKYLTVKLNRKKLEAEWDHSSGLAHKFTIPSVTRAETPQELVLEWDGTQFGVKRKGSTTLTIPPSGEFSVITVRIHQGETPEAEIVLSDPPDPSQDLDGLIYITPSVPVILTSGKNIISVIPAHPLQETVTLNIDESVRSTAGKRLPAAFSQKIDLFSVMPAIQAVGKGVILPTSKELIFPFRTAALKAVDLTIIKIFGNNLPYFLQESDLSYGYNIKRFGRPVFQGRIDLLQGAESASGSWKLSSINLNDYIEVEPGVLYKVQLGMRKSYATTGCQLTEEDLRYEEVLQQAEERSSELWSNPDVYFDDSYSEAYYQMPFRWEDRNDPCKSAYYSPDKNISRNILASNLGLIAKMGTDTKLRVMVNDLVTALPSKEVSIELYDYQLQLLASGITNQEGSVTINCPGKPFLMVARKGSDRNYLKLNDGNSLSLSSFDVAGNKPEEGIKAFIYGERDVWRPGDSIFLSLLIREMNRTLPPEHPVQFELMNARGQRIDNQIHKLDGRSLLVFKTSTPSNTETGNYTASFRIGGAVFTKRIRIETIKPNRLKIDLSFPAEILGGTAGGATGQLSVKWLNGSTASNLKTSVEYILRHSKTEFERYGQYVFDDPVSDFYSESVSIFNNTIDENGRATVMFSPGKELRAPGMLTALFTTRVQERGGDESITQSAHKYAPWPVFVGLNLPAPGNNNRMLFTDTNNEVRIVTVNEKGVPVRSRVEVSVYKLSYRWWWESDNENLAWYISGRSHMPVFSESLATGDNGEGSFSFNIPRDEWGRYLIRATTPEGHSSGRILLVDWPWEYGMKGNAEGASLLAVSTDKEKYFPGDEIRLSFPSMENARAIVTLENSTGIIDEMRVATGKGSTEVRFRATPAMAPNVYAYVSVIQPHNQTINDMPIRLYGVVPVMVEDPESRLEPRLSVPEEIRSQTPFVISVSEAGRRQMTYTLAVVDEGLLDITGFRTPDPWNYFYSREALGVRTWDIYDFVLGAFGGTLDRILAVGGDEAVTDRTANKAQRFVPVVKFLGPFTLSPGKTNIHTLTLPQYTGSVRTMIIAGNDKAYGNAEKSVTVRDPLMALVTAPRVISPGEKAILPVTIFVQKDGIRNVSIKAEGNDLISFENTAVNIPVPGQGEFDTEFSFTSGEKTGIAKIRVTAAGAGESAAYDLELGIRSPNPSESRAELRILKQGEKWETSIRPFGIEGSNSAVLEISSLPSVNLEKRLDFLVNYPYGCTEQIISAAFPQIWLRDLYSNNLTLTNSSVNNIREAMRELVSRQMQNGGMVPWPGHYQPDNWITSYAMHFIIEAERKGYTVPPGVRDRLISYQKKTAREWRPDASHKHYASDQAYRLFTLALAGEPDRGAMNRLRETANIPSLARWLLAASFAASGRPEIAGDLLDVRDTRTEPEYHNYLYGSELRDNSIILYTLLLTKNTELALPILNEICEKLNRETWFSTQSVAWALFAYMKWTETLPAGTSEPLKVNIDLNGDRKEATIGGKEVWKEELKINKGNNILQVENSSANPAYVSLVRKGIPLTTDATREEKGISMKVEYFDPELKTIYPAELLQGTDFMMVVEVTNRSMTGLSDLALSLMVPSGWEIRNTRLFDSEYGIRESVYDYRDIRDDRVNTFFSLVRGETKTYILLLNAAYKGEFHQPSLWCEAMYSDNCYSRIPGTRVKVTGK